MATRAPSVPKLVKTPPPPGVRYEATLQSATHTRHHCTRVSARRAYRITRKKSAPRVSPSVLPRCVVTRDHYVSRVIYTTPRYRSATVFEPRPTPSMWYPRRCWTFRSWARRPRRKRRAKLPGVDVRGTDVCEMQRRQTINHGVCGVGEGERKGSIRKNKPARRSVVSVRPVTRSPRTTNVV